MTTENLQTLGFVLLAALHIAIAVAGSVHNWRWGLLVLVVPPLSLALMARLPRTVAPLVAGQFAAVFLLLPALAAEDSRLLDDRNRAQRVAEAAEDVIATQKADARAGEQNAMQNLAVRAMLLEHWQGQMTRVARVLTAWAAVRDQRSLLAPRLAAEPEEESRQAWKILSGMHRRELRALEEEARILALGER